MAIRFHRASLAMGSTGQEAGEFAAEITQYVTENLGIPTTWGLQVGGTNGLVHWFSEFEDMAALEAGLAKTLTDPGYLAILAKGNDLFVEGSTQDTIIYMM